MNHQIVKLTIILTFVLFLFIGKTNTVFGECNGTYICNVRDIDGDCRAGTNIKDCSGSDEGACLNSIICGVCGWASSDCWWSTPCDPTSWSACTESCGGGTKTNACGTTVDCNTQACCNEVSPDKPTLSSPANGTELRVGVATTLDWNDIASWGTKCPTPNSNSYNVCLDTTGSSGCNIGLPNLGVVSQYSWTPSVAYPTVYWVANASNGSLETWSDVRSLCVEGFNAASISYVSAWTPACGPQTRTCKEDCYGNDCAGVVKTNCQYCAPTITSFTPACGSQTRTCTDNDGTCSGTCVGIATTNCQHCNPTIPAWGTTWTTCDGAHKRSMTRTCTENDGLCDGNDCNAYMAADVCPAGSTCTYNTATNVQTRVEDCVGTITGTLFDASDLPTTCFADIGTNPSYLGYRYKNQPFAINGPSLWPPTPLSVSTDTDGIYTRSVFTGSGGTYQFNYDDLYAAGVAESVKTECGTAAVSLTTQGETVTKNTGFWRIYGGWWQAVGGSVYARSGVRSYVPASLPAANQRLILGDAIGRVGVLAHGYTWTGNELGTNPGVKVSVPNQWRIESTYEGLRYDYDYYTTRMNIFDSSPWNGTSAISYNGGVNGYQILKSTNPSTTLGGLNLSAGQKLIILVDGNVSVAGDIIVPNGAFLAVIAKGNITFSSNPSLTKAQGWFVAENINVPCNDVVVGGGCDKDDSQFVGEGSFVGWSNISLDRDMNTLNNDNPSEKFVYRPDFVLNAPAPIKLYTKKFAPFIP